VRKSAARRKQMIKGLPGDYGPPTICIEVLDEQGRKTLLAENTLEKTLESASMGDGNPQHPGGLGSMSPKQYASNPADSSEAGCQQIVPAEFIAGFCYADVNLGPKLAWETMSQTLALVAMILAGMDIGFFVLAPHSATLGACRDVKNEATCSSGEISGEDSGYGMLTFQNNMLRPTEGRPMDFRSSIGPCLNLAATVMAAVGLLALRVAAETRRVERPRSLRTTIRQYFQALCNGVLLATDVVKWACGSLYGGFRNTSFWRRRQFSRQFTVPPETPIEGYSQLPSRPLIS